MSQPTPDSGADSIAGALLWGIAVAFAASLVQGMVAIVLDAGVLYPLMGLLIGSNTRVNFVNTNWSKRSRQVTALVLTYLAITLSPLIAFGRAVHFDPTRMEHTAIGLVLTLVPAMARHGVIGLLNVFLLLSALRLAWVYADRPLPEPRTALPNS